jgi:glutamate carboxypeptidase
MNFFHYYKSRQGEMINLLKELVSCESPSSDKEAVDKCSRLVIKEFERVGAKMTRIPQEDVGDLYLMEFKTGPSKVKRNQILILTHVDTVWPIGKLTTMPFHISGNRVFGPGVLDMKAGLVILIHALRTLYELNMHPQREIAVFINSSEETGHEASEEMIRRLVRKSTCVLCLEPGLPGGTLKTQRKGRIVARLCAKGKTAHAGSPEEGINAIEELMVQIKKLSRLKTKNTTINIGIISGGENANTVPSEAYATLDIRFWKHSQSIKVKDHLKHLAATLPGARISYTIEKQTPPMEHTAASARLFSRVKQIANSINIELKAGKTGGGSDASIASNLNIATLDGLGPEGGGIHAENEYVLIPSLIERVVLLTEIFLNL